MDSALTHARDMPSITQTSIVIDILKAFEQHSDNVIAIFPEKETAYTYREIFELAKSVAVSLMNFGLGVGETMLMCTEINVDSMVAMTAAWFAGATTSPMNTDVNADELAVMIGTVEPKLIFCSEKYIAKLNDAVSRLDTKFSILYPNNSNPLLDFNTWKQSNSSEFRQPAIMSDEHILAILFTSGTTGVPKGIKVRDVAIKRMASRLSYDIQENKLLSISPMFWISYSFLTTMATLKGKTMILTEQTPAPVTILEIITKYKPDFFLAGCGVWFDLCNLPEISNYDISSLKCVYTAGSYMSGDMKRKVNKQLFGNKLYLKMLYGSTEAGPVTYWPDKIKPTDPEYESVGKLQDGIALKIVDPIKGTSLGPGVEGEICVKSDMQMGGIVKKKFENIEEIDSEGWLHTGDIGYYDEKKFLYFVSRLKDVMKYRGYQIAPTELENVLIKHPDVIECCVIGKSHPGDGEWPAAYVVKKIGSTVSELELCSFVADQVPDFKKLRGGVYFINTLPKTASGKISRNNLKI